MPFVPTLLSSDYKLRHTHPKSSLSASNSDIFPTLLTPLAQSSTPISFVTSMNSKRGLATTSNSTSKSIFLTTTHKCKPSVWTLLKVLSYPTVLTASSIVSRTIVSTTERERDAGSPEYKNGELSTKVESFAFGLLILEALTGYGASVIAGSRYCNLLAMFEQDLDTASNLLRVSHLDKRVCWSLEPAQGRARRQAPQHRATPLPLRRSRRAELVTLIPELEQARLATESLPNLWRPVIDDVLVYHCLVLQLASFLWRVELSPAQG